MSNSIKSSLIGIRCKYGECKEGNIVSDPFVVKDITYVLIKLENGKLVQSILFDIKIL